MPRSEAELGIEGLMFYFITARAHVSETQVFEDYLNLFLPFVVEHKEYHYSIEKDDSCDRHIHVLLEDNAKDMNAFMRKLNTKKFKLFWSFIQTKLSHKDQLTYTRIIKPSEVKETIGYIFKEVNSRQGSSKFNDKAYIQDCVEHHWTMKRLKAQKDIANNVDVKIVTGKNFYSHVQTFCEKNSTRYDDPDLLYKMKKAGYGFINITRRQKEEGFRELRIIREQELTQDKVLVKGEMYENTDHEKEELMEELLTLLYADKQTDYNLEKLRKKYATYSHNIGENNVV